MSSVEALCVSTFATELGKQKMLATLTSELELAHNAWMLDDAVCGCLTEEAVLELLADFGLGDTKPNRALFRKALDTALSEGF